LIAESMVRITDQDNVKTGSMFNRNSEAIWTIGSDRSTIFFSLALLQIFSWFSYGFLEAIIFLNN